MRSLTDEGGAGAWPRGRPCGAPWCRGHLSALSWKPLEASSADAAALRARRKRPRAPRAQAQDLLRLRPTPAGSAFRTPRATTRPSAVPFGRPARSRQERAARGLVEARAGDVEGVGRRPLAAESDPLRRGGRVSRPRLKARAPHRTATTRRTSCMHASLDGRAHGAWRQKKERLPPAGPQSRGCRTRAARWHEIRQQLFDLNGQDVVRRITSQKPGRRVGLVTRESV